MEPYHHISAEHLTIGRLREIIESGCRLALSDDARRSWARNEGAMFSIRRQMELTPGLRVTMPNLTDDATIRAALEND